MSRATILALKMIAATAEKLADDLEKGRLWEGDYASAVSEIGRAYADLPKDRP